jgi:broad specificity phosphatase PhoE
LALLDTKVFLIRHGVTDWHRDGKLLGQRDIPLNDDGRAQAERAAEGLDGIPIAEVISSPLLRALQSAEAIGERVGIEVARDPRLTDLRVGKWEGRPYDDIAATEEYQSYLADPLTQRIPGGESLGEVQRRATAAIEQALADNPSGDAIAVVTHAGVIRILLAHYLGSAAGNYHRIRVSPGSISVLSFADDRELPRVLAVNWCPSLANITSD